MRPLLFLDEIGESDLPSVGAKAGALARLKRMGFPVPDGFVLLPGTGLDHERLGSALARLGGPVAVRSSSTAEDGTEASFAGQYVSTLGVAGLEGVVAAAAACRETASAAAGYARAVGAGAGAMAVLVQRMVEPRVAGVAFGQSPGDPSRLLVEATRGCGDRLLAGQVSPDRYAVDRASGELVTGPANGCLDSESLAAVVALVLRVEEAMGSPQDVEWAIGPGPPEEATALLQARPITTTADDVLVPDPRLHHLTRANIGEVLPGPVTPLTFTTVGAFLEHAFRHVLTRAGLLAADAPLVVVLHRQRLYLNLSLALDLASRLPGLSAKDAERLLLGAGTTAGVTRKLGLRAFLRALPIALRLLALAAGKARAITESEARVDALASVEEAAAATAAGLAGLLVAWAETGRQVATTHVLTSGASAVSQAWLARVLRLLGADTPERLNRLTAGLDDVASAAPAVALERIAARAASQEDWKRFLAAPGVSDRETLAGAPEELARELRTFLASFGHRALSEGELASSSWADDPTPVLDSLRSLVAVAERSALLRATKKELRRAEEEALRQRAPFLLRGLVERALTGAQRGVREREHTKSLTVAVAGAGRRLVRVAGRRLAEAGELASPGDVFFLEWAELLAALRGEAAPRSGAAVLSRRRRRFEREGRLEAPREVDLRAGSAAATSERTETGQVLRGQGVSSGTGRGRVRLFRPGESRSFEPGDVLVAPVLDAALGPLFASAAGVVAEMGGALSHGAVVARELGVPCVVDVRGAMAGLREGEVVLVDGGTGEVHREPATAGRDTGVAESGAPSGADAPGLHVAEDDEEESFAASRLGAPARESVYFNVHDAISGVALIATLGVRAGNRGEAVLALSLPDGRLLFGLDFAPATTDTQVMRVAGAAASFHPIRLQARARLSPWANEAFPPGVIPLLAAPRTVEVELDLEFRPATSTVDFCRSLAAEDREAVRLLGDHHLEQAGVFSGRVIVDGRGIAIAGTGTRDHSWGRREWRALDHSRLFLARFDDDLALHALALSARGRLVEGGVLWRRGRAERVSRILYATEHRGALLAAVEVEVRTASGEDFRLRGRVERTLRIPVEVDRRPLRHLVGRPYALLLHENFVRWEAEGRTGVGIAELSERP
jgi:rifampicin phosphotransferase